MHRVKASDLVGLRKSLAEERADVLASVRSGMPDELRQILDVATASTWIPETQITAIYSHFCRALFPGVISPFIQLGRHNALRSYRGVYRVFLQIPSTAFVISRAAPLWASYHSTGKAEMEDVQSGSAVLVVRGADPITKGMIDVVSGHILALAELTGAKDPLVLASADDPAVLRWTMRWK